MKKRIPKKTAISLVVATMSVTTLANEDIIIKAFDNKLELTDFTPKSTQQAYLYLSDIGYVSNMSHTSWSTIKTDTNVSGGTITLNFDGEILEFEKGFGAHATSSVVFDVSAYSKTYTRFTTYMGVDRGQGNNGNGVKFTVSTSMDGQTWTEVVQTEAIKGNQNSVFVDIDITDVKYVKLYAHDNGSNGNDHAVYGSPRIMKADYDISSEYIGGIKTVDQYDTLIKSKYSVNEEITGEYEHLLLQRTFVNRVGFNTLQALMKSSTENEIAITWLLNNPEALKLYVTGGEVEGTYKKSMESFVDLYTNHHDDFNDSVNGDLYLKMAVSLSLTHSKRVRSWVDNPDSSDPSTRYEIYKDLYHNGKMSEGGDTELFKNLPVELMRWVMDDQITNEEIPWLVDYALSEKAQGKNYLNAYNYIQYKSGYNYNDPQFYDLENYDKWNEKYNISTLSNYGTTNYQRLWMVYESGAVCGGLAKTYANLGRIFGYPAGGIGQPGHGAAIAYRQNAEGKGIWSIQNDVSGWTKSEKGERMLLGWGSKNWDSHYNVSYIFLSQAALDDFENLTKAQYYNYLADVYKGDADKQIEIYNKALEVQKFNLDALVGLIDAYKLSGYKTSKEYLELTKKVIDGLKFFPLPFVDVMNLIAANLTDDADIATLDMLKTQTLKQATQAKEGDTTQPRECVTMANYLLGEHQVELASFSFNGDTAGQIIINDKYEGSSIRWEYSLDGWETKGETDAKVLTLTPEELAMINTETDIQISLVGTSEIYTIDIMQHETPSNLYLNDLENQFRGVQNPLEYSEDNGETWITYDSDNTRITEDKTILVRYISSGTNMQSEISEYTFTADNQPDNRQYITLNNVTLHSYSSQENSSNQAAINMIDGNGQTGWHNRWSGEEDKYYAVEFDQPRAITSIEYLPNGGNGRLRDVDIYTSMDGVTWEKSGEVRNLANNDTLKVLDLDESTMTKYIKLQAVGTHGNPNNAFFTGKMLNFFEDHTYSLPKIKIEDSIVTKVGQPIDDIFGTYTAKDIEDGDLTEAVQVSGEVNFNKPGEYPITYTVTDSDGNTTTETRLIIVVDLDDSTYLSDINWISANSGWKSVQKNSAVSGSEIRLTDEFGLIAAYEHGIGTHATSTIIYDLTDQDYDLFTSYVGVDRAMYNSTAASVVFQVFVDGIKVADTGLMSAKTPQKFLEIDIHDAKELKLVVTDNGNGNASDHANWADAKLHFANEERAELDFTALNTLLDEVKTLNAEDFTVASWDYLTRVVEQVETTLAVGVNQSTIDKLESRLADAKHNLVSVADYENLKQLVAQGEELISFIYSNDSWNTLSEALQMATDLIAQETPASDDISDALTSLQAALDKLVLRENKVALNDIIQSTTSLDVNVYDQADLEALAVVVKTATSIYENMSATDEEIANMMTELEEAIILVKSPKLTIPTSISSKLGVVIEDVFGEFSAIDPEDGDLTASVEVSGDVNIHKTGEYTLTYTVTDQDGHTTTKTRIISIIDLEDFNYLSDFDWKSANTGWGSVRKDISASQNTLRLTNSAGKEVSYEKGIGTHAPSTVIYDLTDKDVNYFTSYVGVDRAMYNSVGTIVFQVFVDGKKVADTGVMTAKMPQQFLEVDLSGAKELKLVVTDGGNGNGSDHATWGDAKLHFANSEKAEVTREALDALFVTIEGLNADDFTTSSWTSLIKTVETVKTDLLAGYNQAKIDELTSQVQTAMDELVSIQATKQLQQLIEQAQTLEAGIHTATSWNVLSKVLEQAESIMNQPVQKPLEVMEANANLTEAIQNLEVRENKVVLRDLLTNTNLDESLYSAENFASFETIKEASTTTYENLESTDEEVAEAIENFKQALQTLTSPMLSNVEDLIATPLHENFDLRANITALDPEDGDLTAHIQVDSNDFTTEKAGTYEVTYSVTDSQGQTVSKTSTIVVYSDTTFLSDLDWTSARTDYDRVYKDASGSNSLKLLVDGEMTEFAKGFKVHANGEIIYNIEGSNYEYLETYVGVDKNMAENNNASIVFQIFADGEEIYNSGLMKHQTNAKFVRVPVAGVSELKLVVNNGGNGNSSDHGIFGGTQFLITDSKPTIEIEKSLSTKLGLPIEDIYGTYSAHDAEDGDLTDSVEVSGEVNFNKAGEYEITYTVTDSDGNTTTATRTIAVVEMEDFSYLTDYNWTSTNNSYSAPKKDVGHSGNALRLTDEAGEIVTYERGIGAHSTSTIVYDLTDKNYDYFTSFVGVDRQMYNTIGSVNFQVFVDGIKVADTGLMTAKMPQQFLEIDINGAKELKLVVTDGGNGNGSDHATWGDTKLHFANNESIEINRVQLDELLAQADQLKATHYTETSYQNFMAVVASVNEKLISGYNQAKIDSLTEQLTVAYEALELSTNYDNLSTLVAEAQALDLEPYTVESIEVLQSAIAKATEMIATNTSNQDEVDAMIQTLQAAIEQLEVAVDLTQVIEISDSYLKAEIKKALNLTANDITLGDLLNLTNLNVSSSRISNLKGLEYATNLETLDISYNEITDLSPLKDLKKLKTLVTEWQFIEVGMLESTDGQAHIDFSVINRQGQSVTPKVAIMNNRTTEQFFIETSVNEAGILSFDTSSLESSVYSVSVVFEDPSDNFNVQALYMINIQH